MSEHPTDAHCLFTFVFKQALTYGGTNSVAEKFTVT